MFYRFNALPIVRAAISSSHKKSNRPVIVFTPLLVLASLGLLPATGITATINSGAVNVPGNYPSPWDIGDILVVGDTGNATLNILENGAVKSTSGYIGYQQTSTSFVTVSGESATWNLAGALSVGTYGNGTLSIGPKGVVASTAGYIGHFNDASGSGIGVATVSGAEAKWNTSGAVIVGVAGNGTLTISDGGAVTSNAESRIGNTPTALGRVTVTGKDPLGNASVWAIKGSLLLGSYGSSGRLDIVNGGQVILTSAGIVHVQARGGATNSVIVSGAGSSLSAFNVVVASADASSMASLLVDAGAQVTLAGNGQLSIANGLDFYGKATLSGQGTRFLSSYTAHVAHYGGNGVLTIEDGAYFTSDGAGIAAVGSLTGGPTGMGLIKVSGSGSEWVSSQRIVLGYVGGSGGGGITYDPSWGTLLIDGGAKVSASGSSIGNGSVTVAGSDSHGNASTWFNTGLLYLGSSPLLDATALIKDGGQASSQGANIGGGIGTTLTVSGHGSAWANTVENVVVGYLNMHAHLAIEDGALVTNTANATIGNVLGGTVFAGAGVVSLSGPGSRWINDGYITVADGSAWSNADATGSLSLGGGGYVSSAAGYIGGNSNSVLNYGGTGAATVFGSDGSGNASTWNIAGDLIVGVGGSLARGTGTLTLSEGGKVSAGAVQIAQLPTSTGTINIGGEVGQASTASGLLTTPTIAFGAGNGLLHLNYLDAHYTLASAISGPGKIAHNSTGTTLFSGNSAAFSGQTQLDAGTIHLTGTLGNAASTMTVNTGATLSGGGTLGGAVTVADGGKLVGKQGQTLTMGSLVLANNANLNVALGAPSGSGLFTVNGNLTLDGILTISNLGGFGKGVYRLIDYTGVLTDNGMTFGALPTNVPASKLAIQTSIDKQVNLLSGVNATLNFWDGPGTPDNNLIEGATAPCNPTASSWTDKDGETNGVWGHDFAIFMGNAGVVTVDDSLGAIETTGMQFAVDGYVVDGDDITLTGNDATIRVGVGARAGNGMVATIASALKGLSALVKTDDGTLILQGNNTYAGGTRIAGGVLQVSSDANLGAAASALTIDRATLATTATFNTARDTVIETGFATVDTLAGTTLTLAGTVSGDGSLVKQGDGTLVLAGVNRYAGNTLVQAGTLKGDAARIRGHLLSDAITIFDQTLDATFSGHISGSGTVVKAGAAALTLGGTSTASWRIDQGILSTDAGRFGGNAAIGAGGTLNFAQDADAAYHGVLSGTGAVTKTGNSLLTLSSDSSGFTGRTDVMAGALVVNGKLAGTVDVGSGATLGGVGRVGSTVVNSGGTIAPGLLANASSTGATLHVDGDLLFENAAAYAVTIRSAGLGDLIDISGRATLDGAVQITKQGAIFAPGNQWTILSAAQGIDGVFVDLHEDLPYVGLFLSYDANHAYLNIARNDSAFCLSGFTYNQCSTATGAESLGQTHQLYQALASQTSQDAAAHAFDQVSGELHASVKAALIEDSRFVRDAAIARLRISTANTAAPLHAFWAQGFGSWGRIDGDGNAAPLSHDTSGLLLGADMPVSDAWRLGWLGGYSRSTQRIGERNSSASSDTYHLGLYSGAQWDNLGLRSGLAYSWHDIKTSRSARFPGFTDHLNGDYRAGALQAFADLGYRIDTQAAVIEPFVNVAHIQLRTDGYTERGGVAALSSRSQTTDTTITTLGVRGSRDFTLGQTQAQAHLTLAWKHALGDTTPQTHHAFAGGDRFTVKGTPVARNAALIETGLDLRLSPSATLGVNYSGQLAGSARQHGVNAKLSITF